MSIKSIQGGATAVPPSEESSKVPKDENQQVNNIAKESIQRPVQKKKSRCWKCKKKVGLLPIECRCGYVFCMTHRYASSHDCDFDYKKENREKLKKDIPLIVADKLKYRI